MRLLYATFLVTLLIHTDSALSRSTKNDDYDPSYEEPEEGIQNDNFDEYEDEGNENEENFKVSELRMESEPQVFLVNRNDEVILPCKTNIPNPNIGTRMWYKNTAPIFLDAVSFENTGKNLKLLDDRSLLIQNITEADAGEYTCKLMFDNNTTPSVIHRVNVRTAPYNINLTAENNIRELEAGSKLLLKCTAEGTPKPNITWFKDDHSSSTRLGAQGEVLEISGIQHKDRGSYRCLADNGVNPPAHANISIEILHEPVISVERLLVHAGEELSAELICTVHGAPMPTVNWLKDNRNVPPSTNIRLEVNGHNHILRIQKVTDSDYGIYVCSAKNFKGKQDKSITLVRTPVAVKFIPPKDSGKDLSIIWEVESSSPITEHELRFRKVASGDAAWKVVQPELKESKDSKYSVEYKLTGIEPGQYETSIRSKNSYGWSNWSNPAIFSASAKKHGHHSKHPHKKEHKKLDEAPRTVVMEPQSNTEKDSHSSIDNTVRIGETQTSRSRIVVPTILLLFATTVLTLLRY